jgi:hypothetical protein
MNQKIHYKVTVDFLPFRTWLIEAKSESEARLELCRITGVPYEQTSATFALAYAV